MNKSLSITGSVKSAALAALILGVAPLSTFVSQANAASGYFKCDSGYSLQLHGSSSNPSGARCYKPKKETRVTPNAGCPVGTTYNIDHIGKKDYCLPLTGSVFGSKFQAKCGSGQTKKVRSNADRCYKITSAKVKAVKKYY